jgi:hypothetical protein
MTDAERSMPVSRRLWRRTARLCLIILLLITLMCTWMGILANRAARQRRAAAVINRRGQALYDYQVEDGWARGIPISFLQKSPSPPPPGPKWLRELVGVDYLASVVKVTFWVPDEDALRALDDLPHVASFRLDGHEFGDRELERLAGLKLRDLTVENTSASNAGWSVLDTMTSLEDLSLRGDNVSDATLGHVRRLSQLRSLMIDAPRATDAGLANAGALGNLEFLLFTHCYNMTDATLESLRGLNRLKSLSVYRGKATYEGLRRLQMALPHLQHVLLAPAQMAAPGDLL